MRLWSRWPDAVSNETYPFCVSAGNAAALTCSRSYLSQVHEGIAAVVDLRQSLISGLRLRPPGSLHYVRFRVGSATLLFCYLVGPALRSRLPRALPFWYAFEIRMHASMPFSGPFFCHCPFCDAGRTCHAPSRLVVCPFAHVLAPAL